MSLIQEIEKMIAELPSYKATIVKYWLDEFESSRRHKRLKAYTLATKVLADFERTGSDSSLN